MIGSHSFRKALRPFFKRNLGREGNHQKKKVAQNQPKGPIRDQKDPRTVSEIKTTPTKENGTTKFPNEAINNG